MRRKAMNVGDLQQFVGSLATIFAAKTGNPHADMTALVVVLEPFKDLSLAAFAAKLQLAKEYEETGKITVPAGKKKTSSGAGTARAPRTPTKTKDDAAAIQEAIDELERLYSHAADPDLTYTTIETTVKQIHDGFDKEGLKEVAKGFNLTSGVGTKKTCREKMEHKIKERKARNEKGEVIAAAAKAASLTGAGPQTAGEDDIAEATLFEGK
jgi:hypothetical protein